MMYRALLIGFVVASAWTTGFSRGPAKHKVLILADEWAPMHALERAINREARYLVDTAGQQTLPGDIGQYRFVFMYVHETLEADAEGALITYTREGGALIVLHHGLASAKMNNPHWLDFMGVDLYPRDHTRYPWGVLSDTTHLMVNLYPGHYITTNGIRYRKAARFRCDDPSLSMGTYPAFALPNTEIFLNQRFAEGSDRTVLYGVCTTTGDVMQPTSGWYRRVGRGWVFYYQAGHSPEDFADDNFSQVIRNTLIWLGN